MELPRVVVAMLMPLSFGEIMEQIMVPISYGGNGGKSWETAFNSTLGCSVQYLSGRAGDISDAISFHHNC